MMERRAYEQPKWSARPLTDPLAAAAVAPAPDAGGVEQPVGPRAKEASRPDRYRAVLACSYWRADAPARRR